MRPARKTVRPKPGFGTILLLSGSGLPPSLRANSAGDSLRVADGELNAIYQEALEAMPSASTKTKLREAQRAWVAFRDAEIEPNGGLPGASGNTLKILQAELTDARTQQLKTLVEATR